MRIGILADIHESTARLGEALRVLRGAGAEMFVTLGDTADTCQDIDATADLLREVNAVGVWGNHDIGLCRDVDPTTASSLRPETVIFMASLQPRLVLDDCLFTHVEPWLDPHVVEQLWHFDPPDSAVKLARSFEAAQQRRLIMGHLHRWSAATPAGVLDWRGAGPLQLDPVERYILMIGAVCDGRFALLDTTADLLLPFCTA